jgi:hypothetical protein
MTSVKSRGGNTTFTEREGRAGKGSPARTAFGLDWTRRDGRTWKIGSDRVLDLSLFLV